MEKEISLVIPTVNEGENLSMTIQSILETTTGAYEILVIDNGSTDGSTDFLEQMDEPRLRLLKTGERLGVASARNYGAAFVESDVLIFVDAHMLFSPNWLPPILEVLHNEHVGMVVPAISAWGNPQAIGYGRNWLDERLEPEWQFKSSSNPYPIEWSDTSYNLLRLIYAHFNEQRIERVITLHEQTPGFAEALQRVKISDIWFRKRVLASKRKYDDDWFFHKFGIKKI